MFQNPTASESRSSTVPFKFEIHHVSLSIRITPSFPCFVFLNSVQQNVPKFLCMLRTHPKAESKRIALCLPSSCSEFGQ
jgi:hypothetical protein